MNKKTLLIASAVIILLSLASLYLLVRERSERKDAVDLEGRTYRNQEHGYTMYFPYEWDIEEKQERELTFFHSSIENLNLPENGEKWNAHKQISGITLVGTSPLTYIDGAIDYNIEKDVYLNENDLTLRQWYDLAALAEALSFGKITQGDFIRMRNNVLQKGAEIDNKEDVFDPWMPRGELIREGDMEFLKVTLPSDHRYKGYQYYITSFEDYIFTFRFGYGGPVIPREMWQRTSKHVKDMIYSLERL